MSFLIKGTVVGYSKSFFGRAGFQDELLSTIVQKPLILFPLQLYYRFLNPFYFYSVWMDALLQVQVDFDATDVQTRVTCHACNQKLGSTTRRKLSKVQQNTTQFFWRYQSHKSVKNIMKSIGLKKGVKKIMDAHFSKFLEPYFPHFPIFPGIYRKSQFWSMKKRLTLYFAICTD